MSATLAESAIDLPDESPQTALRRQHLLILGLAVGVMFLSAIMTTIDDRQVAVAGLTQFPLPELCQSRRWLHLDCPGCGLTRSFIHFFHGRWEDSFHVHRLGWLLAVLVILQIPYRLILLATPTGLPFGKVFPWALCYGVVILLAINWLAKMAGI